MAKESRKAGQIPTMRSQKVNTMEAEEKQRTGSLGSGSLV